MKIDDLKQEFTKRIKSHIDNLDDLLSDATQMGDQRKVAQIFHESVVAENLLECLEGKHSNKEGVEIIVYPVDPKSTPSVRRVHSQHEISLTVGGNLELAKFNADSLSIIINGDAKKTAQPNPYLPPYRGDVVMVSNDWEKLPFR